MQAVHPQKPPHLQQQGFKLSSLPWWAIILLIAGLVIIYFILTDKNYSETFQYLLSGVVTTLRITLLAFPIATIIGLFVGLARLSRNVILNTIATIYIEVVRGIPLVVLILVIAFGLVPILVDLTNRIGQWGVAVFPKGGIGALFNSLANYSIRNISMELRAIIALAIGYGAFEAEVFRAGIQSIGKGQMEAARSLGMNYFLAMRLIILPQAVRRILPPLGNDFIALLKDSSLATVLAVNELTQLTRLRRSSTFRVMEAFNVAAFLYLTMTLLLSGFVRFLERKMRIGE
ncbi:MAG: amino acid ABC transporter permease [Anaerolineales bacterium]|nr:amino acid ABC transporter permease [Anaerolineales bacterium]MDW8161023.1 ABC transporter permease subunit [Anaerolineales bacterium]